MSEDPTIRQALDATTAGVITRPPFLFLGALVLGFAAGWLLPSSFELARFSPFHWFVGGLLIVVGLAFLAAGIGNFSRAGTPVPTNEPTLALATNGIHGWTRNPIYLGMFLIYAGIGVAALSPWILILAVPLAFIIRYGVVAREEAYLERRFGEAYRGYKSRVRRWL
jgi:protein-S-isoprenylcysteine O-methyltransferase Ste14